MAPSKEEGGLGFRNLHDFNLALLSKQLWRILTQPNLLVSKVMRAKYFPNGGLLQSKAPTHASWLWRSWLGAAHIIKAGACFQVGNGKSIKVWDSLWLSHLPGFKLQSAKPDHTNITWVSELILPGTSSWNSELITSLFNSTESAAIMQIPISSIGLKDRLKWTHSPRGQFSVDSAYSWISSQKPPLHQHPESSGNKEAEKRMWKLTWSMNIQGKLKHFVWRAYHRLLPTKDVLEKKRVAIDTICSTCGEAEETVEHLFFQCRLTQHIWRLAAVSWDGLADLTSNFQQWWKHLCNIRTPDFDPRRLELTVYILWNLWKMRNDWTFNAKRLSAEEVSSRAQSDWHEYTTISTSATLARATNRTPPLNPPSQRMTERVGYHHISTSSAFQTLSQQAAFGLLAVDPHGQTLQASAIKSPSGTPSQQIALEAIRAAQLMAHRNGWQKLIIEYDTKEITSLLRQHPDSSGDLSMISTDIILLKHLFDDCIISFVPRHTNLRCNRLALFAMDHPISVNWGSKLPDWLA